MRRLHQELFQAADQLDFVIGALIPVSIIVSLGWSDVLFILISTFLADIAVNHVSFYIGVRNTKWQADQEDSLICSKPP